ncbi:GNAT family N-acetyltransferase [Chloroflexales bacterium ZM16-3]|nr:GNAT family N-acetyltransferase [Chloroflexales bacterium ZM16-3]
MTVSFIPAPLDEIVESVRAHVASLSSPFESFLEDHILASNHYRIVIDGAEAGFCSIHGESLITQFALVPAQRRHGQTAFWGVRRLESVQAAFVPTSDELFLSHAIDDCRQIDRQAYFFQALTDSPAPAADICLRHADMADLPLIRAGSGSFFDALESNLEQGKLYITEKSGECVGFGIIERSTLYADVASVGMYTCEEVRRTGVGTATISALIAECRRAGLRPVAGCWYYNHRSKQTLEAAGMYTHTRLLRVSY